jgi:tRNA A37 methylthiotransferase MiaB
VFGYSDEDQTEALTLENKVEEDLIRHRVEELSSIVDELLNQRAEERIGQSVRVLIEDVELQEGRSEHQGPEVDGSTFISFTPGRAQFKVGEYVDAVVTGTDGADLIAQAL